jgi:hypothetical protein
MTLTWQRINTRPGDLGTVKKALTSTHVTRSIEGEVETPVSLLDEVLSDGLPLRQVLGVDKVGYAACQRQLCRSTERTTGTSHLLAPNFLAHSAFFGFVSIAKTRLHFFSLAPWRIERPTQPIPKTATVEPSFERLALFNQMAVGGGLPGHGVDAPRTPPTHRHRASWSERRSPS